MKEANKKRSVKGTTSKEAKPFIDKSNQQVFFDSPSRAFIQPKLRIGEPDDPFEAEADAMANKVMSMPESPVRRQPVPEEERVREKCLECGEKTLQPQPLEEEKQEAVRPKKEIQRQSPEDEEVVQEKCTECGEGPAAASSELESRLQSSKGQGQPLPKASRASMEDAFGTDFSGVRVHTGPDAVQMNRELSAQAFTHGRDVYFNQGKYQPEQGEGKRLLAHELTHVVQQGGGELRKIQKATNSDNLCKLTLYSIPPDARSSTGHSAIGLTFPSGEEFKRGFYPSCTRCVGTNFCSDMELLETLIGTSGKVCDDKNTSFTDKTSYDITLEQCRKVSDYLIQKERTPPTYNFLSFNCTHFVVDAAAQAGIDISLEGIDEPEDLSEFIRRKGHLYQVVGDDIIFLYFDPDTNKVAASDEVIVATTGNPSVESDSLSRGHIRFEHVIPVSPSALKLFKGNQPQYILSTSLKAKKTTMK